MPDSSLAWRASVSAPAAAATSASPVVSTTTRASTARRPSGVSTKTPRTVPSSTIAPATVVDSSSETPRSRSRCRASRWNSLRSITGIGAIPFHRQGTLSPPLMKSKVRMPPRRSSSARKSPTWPPEAAVVKPRALPEVVAGPEARAVVAAHGGVLVDQGRPRPVGGGFEGRVEPGDPGSRHQHLGVVKDRHLPRRLVYHSDHSCPPSSTGGVPAAGVG